MAELQRRIDQVAHQMEQIRADPELDEEHKIRFCAPLELHRNILMKVQDDIREREDATSAGGS